MIALTERSSPGGAIRSRHRSKQNKDFVYLREADFCFRSKSTWTIEPMRQRFCVTSDIYKRNEWRQPCGHGRSLSIHNRSEHCCFLERDRCILVLFLNCGLRISELIGLNLTDVRSDQLRVLGKGNKERILSGGRFQSIIGLSTVGMLRPISAQIVHIRIHIGKIHFLYQIQIYQHPTIGKC